MGCSRILQDISEKKKQQKGLLKLLLFFSSCGSSFCFLPVRRRSMNRFFQTAFFDILVVLCSCADVFRRIVWNFTLFYLPGIALLDYFSYHSYGEVYEKNSSSDVYISCGSCKLHVAFQEQKAKFELDFPVCFL